MARVITLVLMVAVGLVFLSRSCTFSRPGAPIALLHGRIVDGTGSDTRVRFVTIVGGRIAAVAADASDAALPDGAEQIDATGLFVAAATFDTTTPTLLDGIRHVWIGQMSAGDPGDVVLLRVNPGRVRPGQVPDDSAVVGAVVDGVYYTGVDIRRRR